LRVGSDGVVAASATNKVGFSGSGGFPLGIGLYGDVFFLRTRKARRKDCGAHPRQLIARSLEVSLTNAIAIGNGKDEDYEDKVEKSKHEDTEEKTEYEDSREEAGCVLWDLAANQIHTDFLVSASRTNLEILR
jgi:hypothetical protein